MASKMILAVALISALLPYLTLGQTVTTSCSNAAGCANGCCVINRQASKFKTFPILNSIL